MHTLISIQICFTPKEFKNAESFELFEFIMFAKRDNSKPSPRYPLMWLITFNPFVYGKPTTFVSYSLLVILLNLAMYHVHKWNAVFSNFQFWWYITCNQVFLPCMGPAQGVIIPPTNPPKQYCLVTASILVSTIVRISCDYL